MLKIKENLLGGILKACLQLRETQKKCETLYDIYEQFAFAVVGTNVDVVETLDSFADGNLTLRTAIDILLEGEDD
jgi:hypothetical protein